jgi:hypothetical protein
MDELLDVETLVYETISRLKGYRAEITRQLEELDDCSEATFVYLRQKREEKVKAHLQEVSL